jgi:hypothetical protein
MSRLKIGRVQPISESIPIPMALELYAVPELL